MDFLTQLLMGQTAPFTGAPGQAGYPAILDPRNATGGLRTQVLPDPINPPAAPPGFMGQPTYPPLGASLAPTTSSTNAEGQPIDEQGNPLPSYARGERPFGNASVSGGGGAPNYTSGTPQMGGQGGQGSGNKLVDALRGIAAPPRPDVVKPSTPHLPPLRSIEGGGLIQLMASLGISPKDVPGLKQSIGR